MAEYIYNFNFFGGFIISALVYWGLCRVLPIPACSDEWLEVDYDGDDVGRGYDVENPGDVGRDEGNRKIFAERESLRRKVGEWQGGC